MVRTRGCQKCRAFKTTVERMEPGSESCPLLKWQMIEIRKYIKKVQIHQYIRKRIDKLIFRNAHFNSCLFLGLIFCPNSQRFTLVSKLKSQNVKSGSQISQQKLHTPLKWYWPKNLHFKSRGVHFTTDIVIISQEWGFGKANICILVIEPQGEFFQQHINWNRGFHHLLDKVTVCARRKINRCSQFVSQNLTYLNEELSLEMLTRILQTLIAKISYA